MELYQQNTRQKTGADYYPLGLNLAGIEKQGSPSHPYQYNAQSEKQKHPFLARYFYETPARMYDPTIGRFGGVDAYASSFPGLTPYNFAGNDPVNFNDPSGDFLQFAQMAWTGYNLFKNFQQNGFHQGMRNLAYSLVSAWAGGLNGGGSYAVEGAARGIVDNLIHGLGTGSIGSVGDLLSPVNLLNLGLSAASGALEAQQDLQRRYRTVNQERLDHLILSQARQESVVLGTMHMEAQRGNVRGTGRITQLPSGWGYANYFTNPIISSIHNGSREFLLGEGGFVYWLSIANPWTAASIVQAGLAGRAGINFLRSNYRISVNGLGSNLGNLSVTRISTGIGRIKSLRGKSLNWIKKQKPRGWKTVPKNNGKGWKWLDEQGRERLIYQRPSGTNAANAKWSREANGYFRWLDEQENFLDVNGKVVPKTDPNFQWRTHIPYEGLH
ncbi:MAG: hypothetical protein HC880_05905 [Bacteroidia bacterium]|nr:hypothetical protein [Bacteroidia bacterium]